MLTNKQIRKRQNCCIPGCNSNALNTTQEISFHTVPTGKRDVKQGLAFDPKAWCESFKKILFQFVDGTRPFSKQIEEGKIKICSNHFKPEEIIKTTNRSWIKFGSIPTLNLPDKMYTKPQPTKRKKIIKNVIALPEKKKRILYNDLNEVKERFNEMKLSKNWKMSTHVNQESGKLEYLMFLKWQSFEKGVSVSLAPYITVIVWSDLSAEFFFSGVAIPATHDLNQLVLAGGNACTIAHLLTTAASYKHCRGHSVKKVPDLMKQKDWVLLHSQTSAIEPLSLQHCRWVIYYTLHVAFACYM